MNHEVDTKVEPVPADVDRTVDQALFHDARVAFGLSDEPGKAAKAEPVRLMPDMIVTEAVEAIVQNCLTHFRSNELVVAKRREAAALHQLRVSMRRLRAALSLFRPALADAQFEAIRQELRWFTGQLGEGRDLDVFLTQKNLPKPMRQLVKADRKRAYDDIIEALQSERLRLLLIDVIAWVELGRWRQSPKACRPLPDFVSRRLFKWWQKVARHRDLESMRGNERHDLRIEIKKLRYALDFVQPLHQRGGRKAKQFYRSVERLQDNLGKLNDLVTARELWRKFGHKPTRSKIDEREIQQKCLKSAQASLDRLKTIGPYWTRLT